MVWKIGKRRSSYPSCPEEHRRLPILRVEVSDLINQHRGDAASEVHLMKHSCRATSVVLKHRKREMKML